MSEHASEAAKLAASICHPDQMIEWVGEVTQALGAGGWLRDDLSYDDGIKMGKAIERELRDIVEAALGDVPKVAGDVPVAASAEARRMRDLVLLLYGGLKMVAEAQGSVLRAGAQMLCVQAELTLFPDPDEVK